MIDKTTIDRIFSATDIVEVIGDFVTLRRKGTSYTACCPFHSEKTPSFMVSPAKGVYKCFGCGKGGSAVNFVMEHEKMTYPEALRYLAKKYNIEIEEKPQTAEEIERNNDRESMLVLNSWAQTFFASQLHDTPNGKAIGLSYFHERGFTEASIQKFGLGYCPEDGARDTLSRAAIKGGFAEQFLVRTGLTIVHQDNSYYDRFAGRVIFPIFSISGRVIGFGGRTMRNDKKTAKYLNSPQSEVYDKSHTLYGIFQAKKAITTLNKCILVEGYTDVMQMHQSGVENVVASSGTSLTVEQVRLIKRFTRNVTVIYDGDQAGIKASLRGIDIILAEGLTVRVVPLPQGEDPDSFARAHSCKELTDYIEAKEEDFLAFKTRILLSGQSDPIARAELINDIVRSVAVIPDAIAREVYIGECSRAMDISSEVLSRSVAQAMVRIHTSVSYQNGAPSNAPLAPNTQATPTTPATQTISPSSAEPAADVIQPSTISNLAYPEEVELAGYLIKYGTENFLYEVSPENEVELGVTDLIVGELAHDDIEMVDQVCNMILAEAKTAWLRDKKLLEPSYYVDHQDQRVASFAASILMREEAYSTSSMWERFEIHSTTERERLPVAVPKAIVIYKTKVIGGKIAQLQAKMSMDLDSIDAVVIDQIKSLNQARAVMNERYKRLL
ncbi:MAG: DNA primase [Mucinivorans sp.]